MKAIKLKIYQQTANYLVPMSLGFKESYPLPPYSTVIGVIHNLCNFTSYHPMQLSVQGNFVSSFSDLYTRYELGGMPKGRNNTFNAHGTIVSRGIGRVQTLVDINLIVHIVPSNKDELKTVYQALIHPREFPSLGRREDLAQLNATIVDLDTHELNDEMYVKNACYIPIKDLQNVDLEREQGTGLIGTYYNLEKDYHLETYRKYVTRKWNTVDTYYASGFNLKEDSKVLLDSDNVPVFLA